MKRAVAILALALVTFVAAPARALPPTGAISLPPAARAVDLDEHLGQALPLDLDFRDEHGTPVRLGRYFKDKKPVVLALFYYRCPMLCGLVLQGMVQGLKDLDFELGKDYRVLTVSIDPRDGPDVAAKKQHNVLAAMGHPDREDAWPFLVGTEASTGALADALGFRYAYDPRTQEYAHPAAIYVLTPSGRISRYLYGIRYGVMDLRLSLVEAGEGKTGGIVDRVLLTCYHFDPATRRYGPYIFGFMRIGGVVILLSVGTLVGVLFARERRKKRAAAAQADTEEEAK
jgi:protein SCO1/2